MLIPERYLLVTFVSNGVFVQKCDVASAAEVTICQVYKLMLPEAHLPFAEDFCILLA